MGGWLVWIGLGLDWRFLRGVGGAWGEEMRRWREREREGDGERERAEQEMSERESNKGLVLFLFPAQGKGHFSLKFFFSKFFHPN